MVNGLVAIRFVHCGVGTVADAAALLSAVGMSLRPFHLAIPVDDLTAARGFYGGLLGCAEGRSDASWVDFDFFGHQLVAHCVAGGAEHRANDVDGESVPVRHFGIVLTPPAWQALVERLNAAGADFIIPPTVRFRGSAGEQSTVFIRDPAGNALEFKAFADDAQLFACNPANEPGHV